MKQEPNIHFELELKKLKLQAEHGMRIIGKIGEGEVPPEALLAMLDHVESCEKAYREAPQTTVGEFLGNPVWRLSPEIPEDEIGAVLKEVYAEIEEKGVTVNVLHETEERDIYRFITEELIHLKMDALHLPDTMTIFTYERFHPNAKADIRSCCKDFISFFFDSKYLRFDRRYLTPEMATEGEWQHFRNAFDSFTLGEFNILDVAVEQTTALVQFEIDFVGHLRGEPAGMRFAGKGHFALVAAERRWQFAQVQWPAKQG